MTNNVIQFPDKKKNIKDDLDHQTNGMMTEILDLHGAIGCVCIILKEKDSKKFEFDAYAGGREDIFPMLSSYVEKGLKQLDGNSN